jgi:hypothetical protein
MSIKSAPYYWVVCDGCGANAQEDDDYAAWCDDGQAESAAADREFTRTEDGRHWCEKCTTWGEDERVPTAAALSAADVPQ